MSALDNLGTQFDPVSYTGYGNSSAGFGHINEHGLGQQNNPEEANQQGSFQASDETQGFSSSDTTAKAKGGTNSPERWTKFLATGRAMGPQDASGRPIPGGNTGAMN